MRYARWIVTSLILICVVVSSAPAQTAPTTAAAAEIPFGRTLHERITPSLVAVQYTWESELGRREIIGAGVVVGAEGVVITPLALISPAIPDEQLKEFKILLPRRDEDHEELDAVFLGRDERSELVFIRTEQPQDWPAIVFQDLPCEVGEKIYSIGLLPKGAGYMSYLCEGFVSANLRGPFPQVLVGAGGLAAIGSPVFNADGTAIGLVNYQADQPTLLNDPRETNALAAVISPPRLFVPARDFLPSIKDAPTGEPLKLPWIGVPQLTGVNQDVAEAFGLTNQPAVEIGEIIPGTPAEQAGLRVGDKIVKVDGQPLERGDEPQELPQILRRKLYRMKVGSQVTLSVLRRRGEPLQEFTLTLQEQPRRANTAKRFYAEDLGFTAREIVFYDTYVRKPPPGTNGVVVALVRPQSSAHNARLQINDMITHVNGKPVADIDQFQAAYEQVRAAQPRDAVILVAWRSGKQETIRIEPPQ